MKNLFAASFAFAFATAFASSGDLGRDGAPSFNLPATVFAAPGVACNVYYTRAFDSVVPQRYAFEALCETGSAFGDCWRLTPKAEQDSWGCNYGAIQSWFFAWLLNSIEGNLK